MALEVLNQTQDQNAGALTSANTAASTATPNPYEKDITEYYQTIFNRAPDIGGLTYWEEQASSGVPMEQIRAAILASPEAKARATSGNTYVNTLGGTGTNIDQGFVNPNPVTGATGTVTNVTGATGAVTNVTGATGVVDPITKAYQDVLGREPDAAGLQFWQQQQAKGVPIDQIVAAIGASQEAKTSPYASILQDYQKYTGRAADAQGLAYWKSQLEAGKTPEEIARGIALSNEGIQYATGDLTTLLNATLGADFVKKLTPEQIKTYASVFADPNAATQDDKLKSIYKQIALDPTLGPQLKTSNPYLYEAVTPITQVAPQNSGRSLYGYFGMYNNSPILNAAAVDSMIDAGYGSDFSHGRGRGTIDIGWTSNSYSNKILRGAEALGVTKNYDSEGGFSGYSGLDQAADMLKIDKSQFKDKQVQEVTPDQYDENGNLVAKGGQPAFTTDENGNKVPVMKTVSAQDQLYDAINDASKNLYLATMDSLEPGAAVEGGSRSFQTVMYQKVGDKLLAISAPQSHGGMQNYDVYNPSHGFLVDSGLIQGATFVGSMALMAMTAGGAAPLASIGGAVTAGAATGTAAAVVGGAVVGAALAAGNIAGSGGTVTGEKLLPGAIAGGVGAAMGPLLNSSDTMRSAMDSIAKASGGLYTSAQVSNIIGNTLANTLATAARGANGDQILKSFTTSLAANGIGQAAAKGITEALKSIQGFDPDTVAKVAKAGQMLSTVASTAALTGKNQDQIMQSIITQLTDPTKLVGNIVGVATATDKTGVTGGTTKTETETKLPEYSNVGKYATNEEFLKAYGLDPETINAGSTAIETNAVQKAENSGVLQSPENQSNLSKISTEQGKTAYAAYVGSGMTPAKALEMVLDVIIPSAYAGENGELPKTVDGKLVVESVYRQDANGKWGEYIPDGNGGWKSTGSVIASAGEDATSKYVQNQLTGDKYLIDPKATESDVGSLSLMPYKESSENKATSGVPTNSPKKVDNNDGTTTYTYGDGSTETVDSKTAKLISTTAGKADIEAETLTATMIVNEALASGKSIQVAINSASGATGLSPSTISKALSGGTKGTGTTGTGVTGTTGTGVTGTTGTGVTGVTGVTGTGTGVTGTGTGGGTGGDGTGTDVTGTGTGGGGTGTGTGGGGTGTGGGGTGTGTSVTTKTTSPFNYGGGSDTQGIYNLTPGLTKARTDYELAGRFGMATGGAVATSQYDPFGLEKSSYGSGDSAGISDPTSSPFVGSSLKMPKLAVGVTKKNVDYNLPGVSPKFKAEGGTIEGHNPQFFSEGGLGSLENRYVKGDGNGTSDDVPAMLANGEFVIPADVVSALGNGSNDAGAGILDQFLQTIREHKQKHAANKLPPDSKGPLAYLLEAKKRA